ncbi:hypothetical protein BC939DRAFT_394810 [Gamsiella multidivaricata]|uniref:uncharacterized protein n=1 Tax=Gamsiella multidivaricata TaxID=101098 RepID=UPI00221E9274|nr:uncharacterized protein BC939DRAFT_394810 [Gamsiella multidivaricata]KAI7827663.1 hypothetical protein BC939DRAFT_394810 [Gamsiella multidivaricata]
MVNRSVSQPVPSIEALGSRLRLRGYQQVITIPKAFVPIVTFYDPSSGTHCDISINQPLGVHNSRLIKTYSDIDDRFKTLAVAVRQLAKNKGILDGKQGFLSSYALVLMVITFLQDVTEPPILPALQPKAVSDTGQTRKIVDGHDCTFDDNVANYLNFGKDNKKSTGELLVDFCRYFGHQFLYSEQEVNPRMGKIRARPAIDRHFTRAGLFRQPGEHFVCIMDPFIVSRNVARNCRGLKAGIVQATFKEAHTALQAGNILSVLGQ